MYKDFELYKEILDNMHEGIYFVDKNRKISYWNNAAERITGYKFEEIINKHCYNNILNHVDDEGHLLCKEGCPLQKTILDGRQRKNILYLQHKKGHRVEIIVKTIPLYDNNNIIGAVEIFSDNVEQIEEKRELNKFKELALYDELTKLPNRRYIDSYLDNSFNDYKKLKISFAIIMIDIDHFRIFNNTYGHDVGDMVLKMIAETLKNALRNNDFIGRWGGEEFLGIIQISSIEKLVKIVEKIRILVENSFIEYGDSHLNVTISIGSTLVKNDDSPTSIQKRADEALYKSKENGRNRNTIL